MLAFVFGRAHCAPHGVVETAELALGAGVHVAHAADYAVRLIVEIKRVGDEFFEIDLGRPIGTAVAVASSVTTTVTPAFSTWSAVVGAAIARATASAFTRRTLPSAFIFRLRFCHRNPLS